MDAITGTEGRDHAADLLRRMQTPRARAAARRALSASPAELRTAAMEAVRAPAQILHATPGCRGWWRRTRGRHATAPVLFCGICYATSPVTDSTLAAASEANHLRLREEARHHHPGRDA